MTSIRLLILALFAFFLLPQQAEAARLIRATISYDGKVILEGTTSDDGHVDADGVWDYLKAIKFKPTEAFEALKIDPAVKKTVLSGAGPGVALSDSKVTVSIVFGGESKFRELTLTRIVKDAHEREWMLDSGEIDQWFAYRMISRREASKLRSPKK